MNTNPVKATKWKGRVLFSVESEESDKPILKVDKIIPSSTAEK